MEFNQYSTYAYNIKIAQEGVLDEVDCCRQDLMRITEYDDVRNYLVKKYGEFEGKKLIPYKSLEKQVYMYMDKEKIEFCALKNKKLYWGRGWKLVYEKEENN